jgi:hypothetical protein
MMWIPAFILVLAAGWFLARAGAGAWFGRAHPLAGATGLAGLAVLFGSGLASALFFALNAGGLASPMVTIAMLTLLAAASGAAWWITRRPESAARDERRPGFPWTWILLAGLAAATCAVALDFWTASGANPNGEWKCGGGLFAPIWAVSWWARRTLATRCSCHRSSGCCGAWRGPSPRSCRPPPAA